MSKLHDDEFKGSVMTFGEHLLELRSCLWRAIIGLAVGSLLGFFLADSIVRFIQSPLENALQAYYRSAAIDELHKMNSNPSEADIARVEAEGMVFERVYVDPQQLAETFGKTRPDLVPQPAPALQQPSLVSPAPQQPAAGSQPQASPSMGLREVLLWHKLDNDPRTHTKSLSGQEPFMIWLKAALIAGFVIASPWIFYQLWSFVAVGLYAKEKKLVRVYLPMSLGLFLLGVYMSYFVFPPILKFFLSFNRSMGIDPEPRISEWLSFVLFLPLGFGLAFQLPLVMLFLERVGIFTIRSYLSNWRISVLVIWVIAAVLTPGDPYSIFFLAVPLMLLFFGGILLCRWWPRGS
ncbi:MAG TPA: twin-arginine translocase subunit TatC [Pirellulales bacterium]|jgi:sec-independent protein translocase protein TatC|nr:twin-arginine translocase subunit TatC [Pirellulales bacterium]